MDTDRSSVPVKSKRSHSSSKREEEESHDIKAKKRHDSKYKSDIPISAHRYYSPSGNPVSEPKGYSPERDHPSKGHSPERHHSNRPRYASERQHYGGDRHSKHHGTKPERQEVKHRDSRHHGSDSYTGRYKEENRHRTDSPQHHYTSREDLKHDSKRHARSSDRHEPKHKEERHGKFDMSHSPTHKDRAGSSSKSERKHIRPQSTSILEGSERSRPSSRSSEPSADLDYLRPASRTLSREHLHPERHGSRHGDHGHRRDKLERSKSHSTAQLEWIGGRDNSGRERTKSHHDYRSTDNLHKRQGRSSTAKSMENLDWSMERSVSPARSDTSTGSNKKLMLKYMLHEVRELKRQIDPNAPDIHVRQKSHAHNRSGYEGSGSDLSDEEERMGRSLQEPSHRQLPSTGQLSRTYPGPRTKGRDFQRSFTQEEKRGMLRTLRE